MIQSAHSDPKWLEEMMPKMVRNYPLKRIGQTISINGGFVWSDGPAANRETSRDS